MSKFEPSKVIDMKSRKVISEEKPGYIARFFLFFAKLFGIGKTEADKRKYKVIRHYHFTMNYFTNTNDPNTFTHRAVTTVMCMQNEYGQRKLELIGSKDRAINTFEKFHLIKAWEKGLTDTLPK